jgi:2-keto-4-pentenoate hydratase/2-oxohepta-3-ene-1,7-dioic acid hydratase in catechol pathway
VWFAREGENFFLYEPAPATIGDPITIKRILAPSLPTKIVALGLNYHDHAAELGLEIPREPLLFLKPPSSVIGPYDEIIYPAQSSQVDYEAELAVVVGKRCSKVRPVQAQDYILGYTCFNDVTARDLQYKDWQWTRAKSFDTFAPFGPWIETAIEDPHKLAISLSVNGVIKQSSNTSNLIFNIYDLISYISNIMTLEKGDVIATGTPGGIGPLQRGDTVRVTIEGIGVLENRVG